MVFQLQYSFSLNLVLAGALIKLSFRPKKSRNLIRNPSEAYGCIAINSPTSQIYPGIHRDKIAQTIQKMDYPMVPYPPF